MNDSFHSIIEQCEIVGSPGGRISEPALPDSYHAVLNNVDGFVTPKGFFRFFGSTSIAGMSSVQEWNDSSWKSGYGRFFEDIFIIAEDVFGDQYGFAFAEKRSPKLCKVYCEGGRREFYKQQDLFVFLQKQIFNESNRSFDYALALAAYNDGIRASMCEHLSFQLPLICGGEYALSNLGVESTQLHLGLLGQLSRKNCTLADGTKIASFTEE